MLKTLLLFLSLLLTFLIFLTSNFKSKPKFILDNLKNNTVIETERLDLIDVLNSTNSQIKNFCCKNAFVYLWFNNKKIKLNAEVYYEKASCFKMCFSSFFGKELLIGSNSKCFWYWSKRDKQSALYWANHLDFEATRLKTPFDPFFLKNSLGLDVVDLSNSKIYQDDNFIIISSVRNNSQGQPVVFSILIEKETKLIQGFVVKNKNDKILVICEIVSRNKNSLPLQINYQWHEENQTMSLYLNDPKINQKFDDKIFDMPDLKPKINMSDD